MKEASGTAPGLTSLPSGDGGIAPLGDRFQPDLVRGTGSYSVPIRCPKGVNGQQPQLNLTYSTASGNGPFGLGWRLGGMSIERRTDRGLPRYDDTDEFTLGGAEALVSTPGGEFRPQSDTRFWRIRRLGEGWEIRTGDGNRMILGETSASREEGPEGVFSWHVSREIDAAGNEIRYDYSHDAGRIYLAGLSYAIFRVEIAYEPRADILTNCRAGFVRKTAWRGRAVHLHCARLTPTLMRSYLISYDEAANGASILHRLRLEGERDGETARHPDLSFDYGEAAFADWTVHEALSLVPPPSLDDPDTQFVPFTGTGLPDVLQTGGARTYLWRNRGDGWLEGPTVVNGVPSTVGLSRGNVALADLDADGRVDLFAVDQPLQVAFSATGEGGFRPEPRIFRDRPSTRLADPETRLTDLDGDGVTDMLSTLRSHFLLYRHDPDRGWQEPEPVARLRDLERFPDVSLADRGVRLADMTGDGLQDIVLVENGRVRYWPSLGRGRWAPSVEMERAPRLPRNYRDDRLLMADMDGDGVTDIVYRDWDRTLIWLNRSGTGFSDPIEIPVPVGLGEGRAIPCDFFGDGRAGFAWSSRVGRHDGTGYRVLRFAGGAKPYLLTAVDNGMGGRHHIAYSTSTAMRRADADAGFPWAGQVPFVVNVVREIAQEDTVTGRTDRLEIAYHDGVYDGPEREFRGFRRVTVRNHGDSSIPTIRQEYEFFQGDPDIDDPGERFRQRALAGAVLRSRTFDEGPGAAVPRTETVQEWTVRREFTGAGSFVHFPFVTSIEVRELSTTGGPARIERTIFDQHDAFGNVGRRRRESLAEGAAAEDWIRSEERYTFTANDTDWIVHLPVRAEFRDGSDRVIGTKVSYYDGPPMTGLPEGEVSAGLLTRVEEMRLASALLPPGYLAGTDMTALGYREIAEGDAAGFYADTLAIRRRADGNVEAQRDGFDVTVSFVYDTDGVFPLRSTDGSGRETAMVFEPRAGQPSAIDMPDGRRVEYDFDPLGRLIASRESDDAGAMQLVRAWVLDVATVPTSITSIVPLTPGRDRAEFLGADPASLADVSVSRIYQDGLAAEILQVTTAPPEAGQQCFLAHHKTINARGLVSVLHKPLFVGDTSFTPAPPPDPADALTRYDAQGRIVETRGPGPMHMLTLRDAFSLQIFEGTAAGVFGSDAPAGLPARTEHFDARTRVVRIDEEDGTGGVISTSYDLFADGRITAVRGPSGETTASYVIAGPAEPVRITGLDAGARTYYHQAGGRLSERINPDGSRLRHSYDALGRLTRIAHQSAGGAESVAREIVYDADPVEPSAGRFLPGRIALVREGDAEIRYSYNRAGKITREETTVAGITLAIERSFDLQGRPVAITYPDGHRIDYTLEDCGVISAIPGFVDTVTYSVDQNVVGYDLSNGVSIARPRDPASFRLQRIAVTAGGATLRSLDYGYDAIGKITEIRDTMPGDVEHQSYSYDGLHRLRGYVWRDISATGPVRKSGSYVYDAAGNIQTLEEFQPVALNYDDAAHPNRLTSVDTAGAATAVAYDGAGGIESMGPLQQIEYDAFDRIRRILRDDGTELRFAYDPQSRRILKETVSNGITERVRYAAGLFEAREDRAFRYVYLGKALVATVAVDQALGTSITAFHACDHQATVLLSCDETGALIENQRYTPFGAPRSNVALDRFLGRPSDPETGLLHLGARYYAPALGRFVSPDWYVLENPTKAMRIPQGFNVYSYSINNPLIFKDPSGLWFGIDDLIVAAVGFVVGFFTGLIYGLANGQGWDSLLTALETGLTTAAGAWLGWNIGGPLGAIMGGMNGLVSGIHGIYDWTSAEGWFAFLSDSTWGLIGTSLGNVVHIINAFNDSNYREDLSRRQNRHVYEGGFGLKDGFAFTQGNVISNIDSGHSADFIRRHEELHVWQGRIFGPLFQATYIVWGIGGFIVGTIAWFWHTDESYGDFIESAAYYDNPFEFWAYANDRNWPPSGRPSAGIFWDACYRDDGSC